MLLYANYVQSNKKLDEKIKTLPQNTLFYSGYFGLGKLVGDKIVCFSDEETYCTIRNGEHILVINGEEERNVYSLKYFDTNKSRDDIYVYSGDEIDDEIITLYNGDTYGKCKSIKIKGKYYRKAGVRKIDGKYYHIEDLVYCSTCNDYHLPNFICVNKLGILDNYHTSKSEKIQKYKAKYTVGLEIEKAVKLKSENIAKLKMAGWRCERDGTAEGGEYITPILNLSHRTHEYFNQYSFLFNDGDKYKNCGGHIHIGGIGQNKLYEIINCYRPILWGLYPDRKTSRRCHYNGRDKYVDVYKHSLGTVEIRIFPATTGLDVIKFRLALIRFMLSNGVKTKEEIIKLLLTKRFIKILSLSISDVDKMALVLKDIFNEYKSLSYSTEKIKTLISKKI